MFKSTSTKITLSIILITFSLLLFISLFSYIRVQDDFQTFRLFVVNNQMTKQKNIIVDDNPPPYVASEIKEKTDQFNAQLSATIIIAGVIASILCITAGVILGRLITRPLNHLQNGIKSLKNNNYKFDIKKTGEEEFDIVIDEFNSLIKQLDYQEELRKDLISDVSHELKTPVTSLLGQIQAMKDGVLPIDDKRLDTICGEILRLKDLVDKLNEYTSIRSRTMKMTTEPISVKDAAEYASNCFQTQLTEKNIQIEINVAEDKTVNSNKEMLERIFCNLIDNAIKYAECSKITISMENNYISIKDNGKGIDEEHMNKIFERFYRIDKSRNRENGGLGLGLSLVKEMIESHGWKIEATSVKGEGVEFKIILLDEPVYKKEEKKGKK
ncbi:MAG: HAMP domain-containing sensor histidine kinase [bacterium]